MSIYEKILSGKKKYRISGGFQAREVVRKPPVCCIRAEKEKPETFQNRAFRQQEAGECRQKK